jgi:hypothetical protein
VASMYRLQEQIAGLVLGGATLDRVEHELIVPSDLPPDRKNALWLYALSYFGAANQRIQSTSHVTSLG